MLLIGLLLSQLSRVSSVSAETAITGGVYVESEGVRRICAFDPLDVWATDVSGATELPDEQAMNVSAVAAIETAVVIVLVMFFMVSSNFLIGLILKRVYSTIRPGRNVLTHALIV